MLNHYILMCFSTMRGDMTGQDFCHLLSSPLSRHNGFKQFLKKHSYSLYICLQTRGLFLLLVVKIIEKSQLFLAFLWFKKYPNLNSHQISNVIVLHTENLIIHVKLNCYFFFLLKIPSNKLLPSFVL